MDRRSFLCGLSAASVAGFPLASRAATGFPQRPITFIVPVAAGGGSDYIARAVTSEWGKSLSNNASFVVENVSGGGGVIACQRAARSDPDGYTLMQGYVATLGTSPATRTVPYDPIKDFTAVGMIGGTPNVLIVDAKLPIRTLKEFAQYAKAHPNANYGSAGAGSLTHLLMELLKQRLDLPIQHIAYKGIAPAFQDIIGGRTQAMFPGLAAAVPHLTAKTVRPLAVTGQARSPRFPDVPTFTELGLDGFDDILQWYGVSGPAGMDSAIVNTLNDSLNKTLKSSEVDKRLEIEAVVPMPMTPKEFAAYVHKDLERWKRVAEEQNIRLDG